LHGLDHLCIVQVSIAEVEANQELHTNSPSRTVRASMSGGCLNAGRTIRDPLAPGCQVARPGGDVAETRDWIATAIV
jgi:hypothetical protein